MIIWHHHLGFTIRPAIHLVATRTGPARRIVPPSRRRALH